MTTMNFTLQGRDQLSRVLDRAGDSAHRLHRRISAATTNSSASINRFARTTADRMAAVSSSQDAAGKASEAFKKSVISLAPAIIPAAAAMAPLVASTAAAGVAVGVYTAALGPQIAAVGEAVTAEQKYQDAVEESGANSKEAMQAQAAYARQLAKMPPATRQAAAQMSVLKDTYNEWSDSLAKDTLGPFTKGLALTSALLPKLTPLVRGTSSELDRMMTLVGGGMASPGFDRLMGKFTEFSTGTIKRANDSLVDFLRRLDTGQVGGGLREFLDYARAQGPVVANTLRNTGEALLNLLKAGSEVGVGLLQAVNALSKLIAAVPAGAIAAFLQLAIAVKAVSLASAGLVAAKSAIAAFSLQILAMRVAAVGATGPLAAATAAIGALSKTAKLAIAGTAVGALLIAITQLGSFGRKSAPDIDKLTTSVGEFGRTGQVAGEFAKAFGADLKGLNEAIGVIARPSTTQAIEQSVSAFLGYGDGGPATKEAKEALDALDQSLADLVSGGKAELAGAAFQQTTEYLRSQGKTTKEINDQFDTYRDMLAAAAFEQKHAAQSMGIFGAQAQEVQAKLNGQKLAADGLRQSIHALDQAHLIARGGIRGMEAAIDAASEAFKKNGATLDENTAKGRDNAQKMDDLANTTMKAVEAKYEETGSWNAASKVYERGRVQLEQLARTTGKDTDEVRKLTDAILMTPDKTAKLRADKRDIEAKLAAARKELGNVPDSRKAAVRANIKAFQDALKKVNRQLNAIDGTTATTYVVTKHIVTGDTASKKGSHGKQLKFSTGGLVHGPGTGTSDSVPAMLSTGEFVIRKASVDRYGADVLRAINAGRVDKAAVSAGKAAIAAPTVGRPAGSSARPIIIQNTWNIDGAMDPIAVGKQIQGILLHLKRTGGTHIDLGLG